MADWHLASLDAALTAAGWRVVAHLDGDNYALSGTWEIQRNTRHAPLHIDFDGQDDMHCLPMSQSYACSLRETPELSLYFGKPGQQWQAQRDQFVTALDSIFLL